MDYNLFSKHFLEAPYDMDNNFVFLQKSYLLESNVDKKFDIRSISLNKHGKNDYGGQIFRYNGKKPTKIYYIEFIVHPFSHLNYFVFWIICVIIKI